MQMAGLLCVAAIALSSSLLSVLVGATHTSSSTPAMMYELDAGSGSNSHRVFVPPGSALWITVCDFGGMTFGGAGPHLSGGVMSMRIYYPPSDARQLNPYFTPVGNDHCNDPLTDDGRVVGPIYWAGVYNSGVPADNEFIIDANCVGGIGACAARVYVWVDSMEPCARYTSVFSCWSDCACGWCPASKHCQFKSQACTMGDTPAPISINADACDLCSRFGTGTADVQASCPGTYGGCTCGYAEENGNPLHYECSSGDRDGPINGFPNGGTYSWTPPAAAQGVPDTCVKADCNLFRSQDSCVSHCGCGWCVNGDSPLDQRSDTGNCLEADLSNGGFPRAPHACENAFPFASGNVNNGGNGWTTNWRWITSPACPPTTRLTDWCEGIPAKNCFSIAGCGLCRTKLNTDGNSEGVCMLGGSGGNPAFGICPMQPDQSKDRTGILYIPPNSNVDHLPTPVTDPCGAYPVDDANIGPGFCQSHCGCGICRGNPPNQPDRCVSGTATGPESSVNQCSSWQPPATNGCNDAGGDNSCWRRGPDYCDMEAGGMYFHSLVDNSQISLGGCGWCDDNDYRGCIPLNRPVDSMNNPLPNQPTSGLIPLPFGRACASLHTSLPRGAGFSGKNRPNCHQLARSACVETCGCGWCNWKPLGDAAGTCVEVDPSTTRALPRSACPFPRLVETNSELGCTPSAAINGGGDPGGAVENGGINDTIQVDDKANLSLVAGCGAILIVSLIWFHSHHRAAESEPGAVSLRAPFPDGDDDQLGERSVRKFLRMVQLYHPIMMLVYAGQRDGFGRGARLFCIFVALSLQLTVTLFSLLIRNMPAYGASLLSASLSFVYEKPIMKLMQFTSRQQCCGSCCNCWKASWAYGCITFLFIQIPAVIVVVYIWGYRGGNIRFGFGFTQLMSAWAASIALGYITAVGSILARFCCCTAKFTREMNEYSREYEKFGKQQLKQLQLAKQPTLIAPKGSLASATAAPTIASLPGALPATGAGGGPDMSSTKQFGAVPESPVIGSTASAGAGAARYVVPQTAGTGAGIEMADLSDGGVSMYAPGAGASIPVLSGAAGTGMSGGYAYSAPQFSGAAVNYSTDLDPSAGLGARPVMVRVGSTPKAGAGPKLAF